MSQNLDGFTDRREFIQAPLLPLRELRLMTVKY